MRPGDRIVSKYGGSFRGTIVSMCDDQVHIEVVIDNFRYPETFLLPKENFILLSPIHCWAVEGF